MAKMLDGELEGSRESDQVACAEELQFGYRSPYVFRAGRLAGLHSTNALLEQHIINVRAQAGAQAQLNGSDLAILGLTNGFGGTGHANLLKAILNLRRDQAADAAEKRERQ